MLKSLLLLITIALLIGCSEKSNPIVGASAQEFVRMTAPDGSTREIQLTDENGSPVNMIDLYFYGQKQVMIYPSIGGAEIWLFDRNGIVCFNASPWGVYSTGPVGGTEFLIGTDQVLGPRQPAIPDPQGPEDIIATQKAILAAMRAHGLIEGETSLAAK